MVECQIAKQCPYYTARDGQQAISAWLRSQYCRGNFAQCARHTVHEVMGQEYVPADLFPNEQARAHQILSRANLYRGGVRRPV